MISGACPMLVDALHSLVSSVRRPPPSPRPQLKPAQSFSCKSRLPSCLAVFLNCNASSLFDAYQRHVRAWLCRRSLSRRMALRRVEQASIVETSTADMLREANGSLQRRREERLSRKRVRVLFQFNLFPSLSFHTMCTDLFGRLVTGRTG